MIIKRPFFAALLAFAAQACMAQTATPNVIATSGGSSTNASASLSWTIGEPFIETGSAPNNFLTQGFQQPSSIIISSADNITNSGASITAYPNPSSALVYISTTSTKPMQAEVFDLAGQVVFKKNISSEDNVLNLGNLANGMYLLKVFTTYGQLLKTMKIDKIK